MLASNVNPRKRSALNLSVPVPCPARPHFLLHSFRHRIFS
jgi:hypothetical protein